LFALPLLAGDVVRAAEPANPTAATKPAVATASDAAQRQIASFKIPAGLQVKVWAADSMLSNPVAISIDEKGRVFVAETHRIGRGVEDNRGHMGWLDDDLASVTVPDRLKVYQKHIKDVEKTYGTASELIRVLEDRSGGGVADHQSVFREDFHDVLDGVGAGILARHGDVYYACIPNLWLLRDTNDSGKADYRESLQYGFGVRTSLMGHDLHGLCIGPDGKLYFSLGDRGFHLVTREGKTIANPNTGGVFRCNLDGGELELFAVGVRNPQKLAFDDYGNLFSCDNNSDSGDRARWIYIVEGGDSGWRMPFQSRNDRGSWDRERVWDPARAEHNAYIVPPVGWLADGPSGLVYYPGTGWSDKWQGHFFLCDFRGSPGGSGVRSLALKPKGASFEMTDSQEFLWHILCTDVAWAPDGNLYVSDWIDGWSGTGKGRIYRVFDPTWQQDPTVLEVKRLLSEGMSSRSADELVKLLGHPDMRIRQEAQFALATKGNSAIAVLSPLAAGKAIQAATTDRLRQLARIHAIWALGQIARTERAAKEPLAAIEPLHGLAADADPEIRAQMARVLGDTRDESAQNLLIGLTRDKNLRVQHLAALALGKVGTPDAIPAELELLRANDDKDAVVRHSAAVALAHSAGNDWRGIAALVKAADDPSAAVRLGVLLAFRRLEQPTLADFLTDPDPRLVLEAARAIHDLPLDQDLPQLAALIDTTPSGDAMDREALMRRVLDANFRLGAAENAAAVARYAARSNAPEAMRIEALEMLSDWTKPSAHDRVNNFWRPLPLRAANLASDALRPVLPGILGTGSDKVLQAGARVAGRLGINEVDSTMVALAADAKRSPDTRVQALRALERLHAKQLNGSMTAALDDHEPAIRADGRRILAKLRPAEAIAPLTAALTNGETIERQSALATLATMKNSQADALLSQWLDKLLAGRVPPDMQLDLLEAAAARRIAPLHDRLGRYDASRPHKESIDPFRESLVGGDAQRGRQIFFERTEVGCVRCHTVAGTGGKVGPELSKIGSQKPREYILESIVDPNKVIAKGFETAVVVLDDGRSVAGIVKSEDAKQLVLMTPEGKTVTVEKSSVDQRASGKSAMPQDVAKPLTKFDLRDLVEFLANQK
jgi:quinoprotein glucose dehydrogenase